MAGKKTKAPSPKELPEETRSAQRLDFSRLVSSIQRVHEACTQQASRAVNVSLTLRNWLIGMYVREFEQNGTDRANYGERLIETLAERLKGLGMDPFGRA